MLSESPVVTVHIPPVLRPCVGGHDEITASGDTVGEVLEAVGHEYPAFRAYAMLADGSPAAGFAVYLGPTSVRQLQGMATPVQMEELVSIVQTGEVPAVLVAGEGHFRQAGPVDRIEHVLDDQPQFGVSGNLQLPIEKQGVGVLLPGQQLQEGRKVGGKGEVGLAVGPEHGSEHAISIGV